MAISPAAAPSSTAATTRPTPGNIRGVSRFTLADGLVLTVDPSYQYVKANGGGTVDAAEGSSRHQSDRRTRRRLLSGTANCTLDHANSTCIAGFFGGSRFRRRDLNGDGDTLDQVTVLAPSQTHTDRFGVIAGLRWDINHDQLVRVSYTLDDAHHRQTGEVGLLKPNGEPFDVFPINDPMPMSTGLPAREARPHVLRDPQPSSRANIAAIFGDR